MSGKKFRSQASSSRAAAGAFGSGPNSPFGGFSSPGTEQETPASSLSYVYEPPDLSQISHPHLVVTFKNLLKKDSITKTRALEELQSHLSAFETSNTHLDDGLLEAWSKVYPRISIDSSRRVRQLAHALQGYIVSTAGKRIARYISGIIGAWLAGLYEDDKLVKRSAQDSLIKAFPTEEKQKGIWTVYQSSILEFIVDATLKQTSSTLSDERTVSPDDAEAKYSRVVATALQEFSMILDTASTKGLEKDLESVKNLLESRDLWKFSYHQDAFVRRSLYKLLQTCLQKKFDYINWKIISSCVISKSLGISHRGSASAYSDLLVNLTSARPQIWTADYSAKVPVNKQLLRYISAGSQGAPPLYWSNLSIILQSLPSELLELQSEKGTFSKSLCYITQAFCKSIGNREEPKANLLAAWTAYIKTGIWLSGQASQEGDRLEFIQACLIPILEQFIAQDEQNSAWTIDDPKAPQVCVELATALSRIIGDDHMRGLWAKLASILRDRVLVSEPEQSQQYRASQDFICLQGKRFFQLGSGVLAKADSNRHDCLAKESIEDSTVSLINTSLQLLQSRNGKPYGAAALVDDALTSVPSVLPKIECLDSLVSDTIPRLIMSPSADWLISILFTCRDEVSFKKGLAKLIDVYTLALSSSSQLPALGKAFSCMTADDLATNPNLMFLVMGVLDQAIQGTHEYWPNIASAIKNKELEPKILTPIFESMVEALSNDDLVINVLRGFLSMSAESAGAIQVYMTSPNGSHLLSKLLILTEAPDDEVSMLSDSLVNKITKVIGEGDSAKPKLQMLKSNFETVNEDSLSIDSLVNTAQDLLKQTSVDNISQLLLELLPQQNSWEVALEPFLKVAPRFSWSIMSPLGGAVYISDSPRSSEALRAVPRDRDLLTLAFRNAYYTTKILRAVDVEKIPSQSLESLYTYLPITIQLIDEELSIEGSTTVLSLNTPESQVIATDIVSEARMLMNVWIHKSYMAEISGGKLERSFVALWEKELFKIEGIGPRAYRFAETFARIMAERIALGPLSSAESALQTATGLSRSSSPFILIGTVAGYRDSFIDTQPVGRLCNQLVADLTALTDTNMISALQKLTVLNSLLRGENNPGESIPTQRLVFLIKHLIVALQSEKLGPGIVAEVLKALASILPLMKDIYGSHWSELFELLDQQWNRRAISDELLPILHASLRLFSCLRKLAINDGNEDLEDVWKEGQESHAQDLASLLRLFDSPSQFNQPWDITADILSRELLALNTDAISDITGLFSSLAIGSRGVQRAAYGVLQRVIPKLQETLSFDVALSKATVSLPDELVSSLSNVPSVIGLRDGPMDEDSWLRARSYLIAWKVIFDHFSHSSIPVQECYSSNMKKKGCLNPLLEFVFGCLESPQGQLIDASKVSVRSFELDSSDSLKSEMHGFLIHIYYLTLRYLPNLTRAWWVDCAKRLKTPVEVWTQKYISPLIIEDSLSNVSTWYADQDWDSEEHALEVKVSVKAAEIIGSIEIDEESPPTSIVISLPPTYPLHQATVRGRSRVAVDEKKWKSWLLVIQGVILFSNGNLMDGLLAFRRNVQGALKGQGECPICCSIISANMQTPNKRCGICKNCFHSDCLFRWFKSSNSSSCPLCRNNFLYA